jgi:tetratricopeptide (TPR) repeat protein
MTIQGYTGAIEAKRTVVQRVGLLGAELKDIEFVVGGNELGAGIMGILGRNFLALADTEYDLAHGTVRLSFPKGECDDTNFAYRAGEAPVIATPLHSRESRGDAPIRITVSINGTKAVALLDTGAPRTSVSLDVAKRSGIDERDLTPAGRVGGAGEGHARSWTTRIATFEVGGEKITDNVLSIDDAKTRRSDLLLGLDYFLSHRIYVSRLQRKVYVTWNGGPVFAQGRATPGDYDARYAALPKDISQDDADALARRGAAALASKNYPRALEDLNRACELAPGVAEYVYARARVHAAMRHADLERADLDEALRLDPALAEARLRRAVVREAQGNRAAAQADLAQLDAALPPSSHLRAGMATVYAKLDQVPEALRQFELWTASHEDDARLASVLDERCRMRTRLNIELPRALEDCKKAVDRDRDEAAYLDSLGWTYLRLGDAANAKQAFERAIKLQERALSLYGRGLAQLRLNDTASGERDLAAARKLSPQIDDDVRKRGFESADRLESARTPGS